MVIFFELLFFYIFRRQRVISVFSVSFISVFSVTISIIFNISFSYISTLNRHDKLIEYLVVYELDVRRKLQGSGDATRCYITCRQPLSVSVG